MVKYSITHRGVILFFFTLIAVLGVQAIGDVGKQENPEFPKWGSVIITRFPGASPLKVEELVTEKIEKKMQEIPEFEKVYSTSQFGVSYVFLKIDTKYWDVKPLWDLARDKLDDLKGEFPEGAGEPWLNNDFGKTKSIVLSISGIGFTNKELSDVTDDLKKEVERVEYVSRADIIGEQEEQIFLEVSTNKMTELGITTQTMVSIVQEQNVLKPGGRIKLGPQRIRLETSGEYQSVEAIGKTLITLPGGQNSFLLKDLVQIRREYRDPPEMQMRVMGKPATGIVIEMQDGGQIFELGDNIKNLVAKFQATLPHGMDINFVNFQPRWTSVKITDFVDNLTQAVLLVAVIMSFLLGWRQGIIIALLIPGAYLITTVIMLANDIPLHQISLAALIIALGMLVDNGIVMTESITEYINQGVPHEEAAMLAGKELMMPLLAATGTTVAAFSPIALARSGVGVYCNSLPIVIGTVLLASFFVAMTLVPILCVWLLKAKPKKQGAESFMARMYRGMMTLALRFRFLTILLILGLFFVVAPLAGQLKQVFFPPSGRGQLTIDMYMPEGTDYYETHDHALKVEQYLLKTYPDALKALALYVGEGGPLFHNSVEREQKTSNYAQFMINTHEFEQMEQMAKELGPYFENNFAEAQLILKPIEEGPPVGAPIQVKVYGNEFKDLYRYVQQIEGIVGEVPGTIGVRNDWGRRVPILTLEVNQENARRVGVSTDTITDAMQAVFSGQEITRYREGDDAIPVLMRALKPERTTLRKLENLKILTSQGAMVPISQVTNRKLQWETGKIKREKRRRMIKVKAYADGTRTPVEMLVDVRKQIEEINFLPGYGVEYGGEFEESAKAQKSIVEKLPYGLAFLVMILVIQFGNVRKMLIILTTIPLSFIGVILGLYIMDYPLSFFAQLGILSLAGIVVNNAILLIEQIDVDLAEGKPPTEAIIHAGMRRAYPIFLTTVTTVAGLYSLAASGLLWGPLAVSIMGGLIVSTFLTLVIAPVLYSIFFNIKWKPTRIHPAQA
jgi:multidrug efflux pump